MRKIKEVLFWGSERSYHRNVSLLQERLEEARSISSALQQPSHSETAEQATRDAVERGKLETQLRDCVADIAAAFDYSLEEPRSFTRWDRDYPDGVR